MEKKRTYVSSVEEFVKLIEENRKNIEKLRSGQLKEDKSNDEEDDGFIYLPDDADIQEYLDAIGAISWEEVQRRTNEKLDQYNDQYN